MPNINPMQFAMGMLQQNPQLQNNPQAKGLMEIIQSGDSERGRQMAENLCKTYGVSPEQAIQDARKFFYI